MLDGGTRSTKRQTARNHIPSVPARTRIDQFEVIRLLGHGGMGEVYLARDRKLGRKVALKLIRDPRFGRLRFFKEAQSTARFNHPNIVTIHTFGEYQGQPYLVLERLNGQTLGQRLKEGALNLQETLRIAKDMAAALVEAHRHGVLHLDLKPDNVMLTQDGRTKVLDFGLAQPAEIRDLPGDTDDLYPPELIEERMPFAHGTPYYMAPEQWTGRTPSEATDVWAFGAIVFEMIEGRRPWKTTSEKASDLGREICLGPTVSFSHVEARTASLRTLVARCLAKSPRERPSADEIGLALGEEIERKRTSQNLQDNPFRGLRAFTSKDADFFFGRSQEIGEIAERIRTEPLLAIVGVSGAGKSSLVQAGVVPRLIDAGWQVNTMRPGATPFKTLALHLLQTTFGAPGDSRGTLPFSVDEIDALSEELFQHPHRLSLMLDQLAVERGKQVLVVDQCEELYTMVDDVERRRTFLQAVALAAEEPMDPVRVLITVRGDFLSRMAEASLEARQIIRRFMLLQVPGRTALIETLVGPVERIGYRFESGLAERMVDDAGKEAAPLPLLQFTAQRLWEERDESTRTLTMTAYDRIGGVSGALIRHGDHILDALEAEDIHVARELLLRMVTAEYTRRVVRTDEIIEGLHASAPRILDELVAARLVTLVRLRSPEKVQSAVELAHESLIHNWARLKDWLDDQQEELRFLNEAREAAELWERRGRSADEVWTKGALAEAERMLEQCASPIPHLVRTFIEAGQALERRKRRRTQGLVIGIIVLLLTGSTALYMQRTQALQGLKLSEVHRVRAEESAMSARNASRMASAIIHRLDPTLALALLREMDPAGSLPAKWSQLARWATFQTIAEVVIPHPDPVDWAEFSPDGNHIATASHDGLIRLYTADGTKEPTIFRGHTARVLTVKFSPDGTRLLSASTDHTARIWMRDGSKLPVILRGHSDQVLDAAFSPDGTRVITVSWDRTARIWNADGSGTPIVFRGYFFYSVDFLANGTQFVTGEEDGTLRLWSVDGASPPVVLGKDLGIMQSIVLHPESNRLAAASEDGRVHVRSLAGGDAPYILLGFASRARSVDFNFEGTRLVSASRDKTVRVWNLEDNQTEVILRGHRGEVRSAQFSPDGTRIVTASTDRTVRVWKTAPTNTPIFLKGHTGRVINAEFSPDGRRVVTASGDGTARIWNADGSGTPTTLQGKGGSMFMASFSPDGQRIVTTSTNTVQVWNADGSGAPLEFRGHQDSVYSATFHPDGKRILTASWDGTARIWTVDGSVPPVVFRKDGIEWFEYVAVSPDGTRFAVAGTQTLLWNTDGSGPPQVLRKFSDAPTVAFDPSGTRLITGSQDTVARTWYLTRRDSNGQIPLRAFEGHSNYVVSGSRSGKGAFSPDGTQVVTISYDETLRIWNADGTGKPAILQLPGIAVGAASFSPDGTQILTASHAERNPVTDKLEHGAMIWPAFERLTGLEDPALWKPTRYCPPVELRMEFLGISEEEAQKEVETCQRRVAAVFDN